ncbi:MAG: hypothetical protein AB7L94_30005 [Kofleriaceae bacterium]
MSRTIPRPLLAALVLPLVVIVGFQSAWAAFACRIDGKVRDECCCKHEKKEREQPVDEPARVVAPGCCDVTIHEAREAPLVREADRATFTHVPVMVPAIAHAIVPPRAERIATIATMPRPPPRIPLFLDKQAILR